MSTLCFYRLTNLWPRIKWFLSLLSSVCCHSNCPSVIPSPRFSDCTIWKAVRGQLLRTPDIGSSLEVSVMHTEANWPCAQEAKHYMRCLKHKLSHLTASRHVRNYFRTQARSLDTKTRSIHVALRHMLINFVIIRAHQLYLTHSILNSIQTCLNLFYFLIIFGTFCTYWLCKKAQLTLMTPICCAQGYQGYSLDKHSSGEEADALRLQEIN